MSKPFATATFYTLILAGLAWLVMDWAGSVHVAALGDAESPLRMLDERRQLEFRAIRALQTSDYVAAVEAFTEVLWQSEQNAEAHFHRGRAYARMGQFRLAIDDFDASVRLTPSPNPHCLMERAHAYDELGLTDEAAADYGQSAAIFGDPADQMLARACMYEVTGNFDEAITAHTDRVTRSEWQIPGYYVDRALCYRRFKRYGDALADLNLAIALSQKNPMAYYHRARVREALGDVDALDDANQAIFLNGPPAESYALRARLYLKEKEGGSGLALADVKRAIEFAPWRSEHYLLRAEIYRALGKDNLADADLEQACELIP